MISIPKFLSKSIQDYFSYHADRQMEGKTHGQTNRNCIT